MRYSILPIALLSSVAACHTSRPVLYADTEAVLTVAEPPALRPARSVDARLRAEQRAQLVVRSELSYRPNATAITLRKTDGTQRSVEQSVDAHGFAEFPELLPGEYTVTARRIGLQPQSVRVMVAVGFADTLVFHLGQP